MSWSLKNFFFEVGVPCPATLMTGVILEYLKQLIVQSILEDLAAVPVELFAGTIVCVHV